MQVPFAAAWIYFQSEFLHMELSYVTSCAVQYLLTPFSPHKYLQFEKGASEKTNVEQSP